MKRFVLALLVLFLMPMYAGAALLVDSTFGDGMEISFQFFDSDGQDSINAAYEEISASTLVPYSSPYGGLAIVNQSGGFFDSTVLPHPDEVALGFVRLSLNILNSSPFPWSDFHFEFYSVVDMVPLNLPIFWGMNDDNFDEINDASDLFGPGNYKDPDYYTFLDFGSSTLTVMPGQSVAFDLKINIQDAALHNGFVLRQIATTAVPVPSAILLLGIGITSFAGIRRKLNK